MRSVIGTLLLLSAIVLAILGASALERTAPFGVGLVVIAIIAFVAAWRFLLEPATSSRDRDPSP
jgi:hypothetical protein